MAKIERILALDIGAVSIKAGEFEYPPGGIRLLDFAHREYEEELTDETRTVVVAGILRQMLVEHAFTSRKVVLSVSGQSAFTRFVKLPPVAEEESRVRQIVEFEARQNVPFPIEEVLWDYQLMVNPEAEELEVMFVVIKNEIVEQLTDAVQAVGLDPVVVDVGPAACYNAARANHVGDEECAMVLNIGGRSTSLLFADGDRFFARTIPIAGHSITQQIAKEFGIGTDEAEELKRRHGFVALGGAYEEPESEVAAAVSKIVRNVMARLHGEINRSISVYRAQQKGRRPERLLLTGGSSIMAFTDHFFAEKLRMEVSYLNPFQVTELAPTVNRQRLQEMAHTYSEVVGLGLRYGVQCPVEVSLVPEAIRRQQIFRRKRWPIAACFFCVMLMLFVTLLANKGKASLYFEQFGKLEATVNRLGELERDIDSEQNASDQAVEQYHSLTALLKQRLQWPTVLNELQEIKPSDVWLVSLQPIVGEVTEETDPGSGGSGFGGGFSSGGGGGEMGMGMGGMGMGMGGGEASGAGMAGGMADAGSMEAGGGMGMGMGGGIGMGMGDSSGGGYAADTGGVRTAAGETQIGGFQLVGHSVVLEGREGAEEAGGDEGTEKKAVDEGAGTTEEAVAGAEAGDGEGEAESEGAETSAAEQERLPASVFLEKLRGSEHFDEDKRFTRIIEYSRSKIVENLSTFRIQVKLVEPIEAESQ